ncbi:MAG: hypothetical protein ACFFBD_02795, partial [Candidatus Hodarchaeota archaeon]
MQVMDILLLGIVVAFILILFLNYKKFRLNRRQDRRSEESRGSSKFTPNSLSGQRFFPVIYAFRSIWTHKKRFVNLSVGFIITVALVCMLFVFIEVAPQEAVKEAIDERSFHFRADPVILSVTYRLYDAIPYIENDPIIDKTELVWYSQAIFGMGNKSGLYQFYPEMEDPDDPVFISDQTELFIVEDSYLQTVRNQF